MTTKAFLLQIIRKHCLDCVSGSFVEVERCTSDKTCNLFPFRFGKDPSPSQTRQEAARIRAKENFKGNSRGIEGAGESAVLVDEEEFL
jgi:hypothetical protein